MSAENTTKYWIITGIISVVAGIIVEIFSSFSIIKLIVEFLTLFLIKIPVPIWLLLLIISLSVLVTISVSNYLNTEPEEPEFKNYTFAEVFGVDWQWNWVNNEMVNLVPLCPECSYQPFLELDYNHKHLSECSKIRCGNCGFEKEFQYRLERLKQKVVREIHRRIRQGEYEIAT